MKYQARGKLFHKWFEKSANQSVPTLDQIEKPFGTDFFCSNCKNYENERNVRPNKKEGIYICTANHTSFNHPATQAKMWYRSVEKISKKDLDLVEKQNKEGHLPDDSNGEQVKSGTRYISIP